jgi:hypothetical protein
VATRAGLNVALDSAVLNSGIDLGPLTGFLDPAIWDISAAIGDTGGKPARLMLREFERYYTDRSASVTRGSIKVEKRFVEERLVYAVIFELPS